jgi:hypothetical protein
VRTDDLMRRILAAEKASQAQPGILITVSDEPEACANDGVTVIVYGIRFRNDGSLGKVRRTLSLSFEGEKKSAARWLGSPKAGRPDLSRLR